MKVLLIGSGGREHALAWKLADSPLVTQLFCAPGNPGTAQLADNVAIDANKPDAVLKFTQRNPVDLVVIGPEDPLACGLANRLAQSNIKVFGPTQEAARLESDKWFAKEIMRQQAVPTAEARSFTDAAQAEEYIKVRDEPCVIKAAGLAKGKGVTVCYRTPDALETIDRIMRKKAFGPAGSRVVIEEFLQGPECSILAFVDRRNIYMMETCQDHKTIDDGDVGPMTGGMGAYCPTPIVTDALLAQIERDVMVPVVDGLLRDGIEYKGVLYAGLMLTTNGPKVLEFNCRFGDPETQPLMMRLKSDLAEVLLAVAEGKLDQVQLKWDERPAVCVVASSKGYPGDYQKGQVITGIEKADSLQDTKVFHSGTRQDGKQILTDGGRVLGVTALGKDIADARARAYKAMDLIHFDGMHYRRDIAGKVIGNRV